ncbi:MAG: hypothetical protein Q9225_004469 [Loekoesia sp. 1 TL-2023]
MESVPENEHVDESSNHEQSQPTSPVIEISKSPRRPRPWSTEGIQAVLSPSPAFDESKTSKDDIHVPPNYPVTPRRPNYPSRGLSLQMPPRDISTEQSSPDSSPVVGGRGGIMIPPRKGMNSSSNAVLVPDSPGISSNSPWSNGDKGAISSSLGTASMMEYVSGSSSSEDDEMMVHGEEEDIIHMTPQIWRSGNGSTNLFGPAIPSSPGADGFSGFSPAAAKLMSFQRARTRQRRSRKSSSSASASAHSTISISGPASPAPLLKSIESSMVGDPHKDPSKREIESRRESLSLGTCNLELSDGDQSEEGKSRVSPQEDVAVPIPATPGDERRNVIRRAVTRRGNLLPKTKNFARIRVLLQEESAPVDTEVKREAEVIRQARESDAYGDLNPIPSQPTTSASSPSIQPVTAGPTEGLEDIQEDVAMDSDISASRRSSSSTFTQHAMRNSAGLGFWNNFDERIRTPPPIFPRESSSGISDDIAMDTPQSSIVSATPQPNTNKSSSRSESRSSTPQLPPTTSENVRKGNKRMRDDDFDPNFFKRRAVSPGMSLQNSPILPQSPLQGNSGWWGMPSKYGRETPASQTVGERISSGGSASSGNGAPPVSAKKVGLQGMSDTNDGLMNMSIE